MNLSRITIDADLKAVALLATEGLYRKQLAARYTLNCVDATPNRTALKSAAEAVAARQAAAELPFFISPDDLLKGLAKLGITGDVAETAVAQVVVTYGIKPEREQHQDSVAASLMTSYLVNVPHLGGIKAIRPTAQPATPAGETTPTRPPARGENPVAETWADAKAALDTAAMQVGEAS